MTLLWEGRRARDTGSLPRRDKGQVPRRGRERVSRQEGGFVPDYKVPWKEMFHSDTRFDLVPNLFRETET